MRVYQVFDKYMDKATNRLRHNNNDTIIISLIGRFSLRTASTVVVSPQHEIEMSYNYGEHYQHFQTGRS